MATVDTDSELFLKAAQRVIDGTVDATEFPIVVLKGLTGQDGHSLQDAQKASKLGYNQFATLINRLEDSGFVKIEGDPGAEKVRLTAAASTLLKYS